MKNKSTILLKIAIIILILTLISALILSSIYAKYTSNDEQPTTSARPAKFELIMQTPSDDKITVNFASDGEPGAPIGYTEAYKDYDFKIKTDSSEVASEVTISLTFSDKIQGLIEQAREDKFSYGTSCGFELLKGTMENGKIVYKEVILTSKVTDAKKYEPVGNTWSTPSITVEPLKNPDEPASGEMGHYRLRMIVYNNTLMPSPSHQVDVGVDTNGDGTNDSISSNNFFYVFSSNAIEIKVSSSQMDPAFVGSNRIQ